MRRSGAATVLHLTRDRPRATPSSSSLISANETEDNPGVAPSLPQPPLVFVRRYEIVLLAISSSQPHDPLREHAGLAADTVPVGCSEGPQVWAFGPSGEPRVQPVGTTDEMHVAASPTFIDFSLANHPSNFTDHSMAPEIFSPPLTCPSPGGLPRFLPAPCLG